MKTEILLQPYLSTRLQLIYQQTVFYKIKLLTKTQQSVLSHQKTPKIDEQANELKSDQRHESSPGRVIQFNVEKANQRLYSKRNLSAIWLTHLSAIVGHSLFGIRPSHFGIDCQFAKRDTTQPVCLHKWINSSFIARACMPAGCAVQPFWVLYYRSNGSTGWSFPSAIALFDSDNTI